MRRAAWPHARRRRSPSSPLGAEPGLAGWATEVARLVGACGHRRDDRSDPAATVALLLCSGEPDRRTGPVDRHRSAAPAGGDPRGRSPHRALRGARGHRLPAVRRRAPRRGRRTPGPGARQLTGTPTRPSIPPPGPPRRRSPRATSWRTSTATGRRPGRRRPGRAGARPRAPRVAAPSALRLLLGRPARPHQLTARSRRGSRSPVLAVELALHRAEMGSRAGVAEPPTPAVLDRDRPAQRAAASAWAAAEVTGDRLACHVATVARNDRSRVRR